MKMSKMIQRNSREPSPRTRGPAIQIQRQPFAPLQPSVSPNPALARGNAHTRARFARYNLELAV